MSHIVSLVAASRLHGSQAALDRVTLEIAPGELVVVMGPSGSGKSTLLNLIAGLDRATSGRVEVAGADLGRLSEAALARHRRNHVGMIFQFFNLIEDLAVLDNISLPAQLGIAALAERHPSTLSGGERQRVAIARALVNRPELLLADEPTGALDTAAGESVLELLLDLNRAGQTLVLVTHDPRLAARSGGRLVELLDGRIDEAPAPVAAGAWR